MKKVKALMCRVFDTYFIFFPNYLLDLKGDKFKKFYETNKYIFGGLPIYFANKEIYHKLSQKKKFFEVELEIPPEIEILNISQLTKKSLLEDFFKEIENE